MGDIFPVEYEKNIKEIGVGGGEKNEELILFERFCCDFLIRL